MNICFFYRIYPSYGGVEVVTTLLANSFIADGHNVVIVSFEQSNLELMSKLDKKVKVIFLKYPIFSFESIRKMRKGIIDEKIDIIVNQWGLPFYTSLFCKIASFNLNVSLISVLHGSPTTSKTVLSSSSKCLKSKNIVLRIYHKYLCNSKLFIIRNGLKYNLLVNDKYILLSNGFIPKLEEFIGKYSLKNVLAIGNPITVETTYNCFSELKKETILYVGRLDYENKRVDRILEFWERIFVKQPNWELVLVGEGPHENELKEYVSSRKIDRVSFYPFQVDPPINYYKEASIFLLTSDLEGFGLVVIESMSYGVVPVVNGSYEAIYDIIEDGKSGFIVPQPFNEDYFDSVVLNLMNDSNQRKVMSKNVVQRSKLFSLDVIVQKWYSVFNECLNCKNKE